MRFRCLILFCLIGLSAPINANNFNLDVYGVDISTQHKIFACCRQQIEAYVTLQKQLNSDKPAEREKTAKNLWRLEKAVLKKINAFDSFVFVNISTVYYQDDKAYTTVDIVKKSDIHRMPKSIFTRKKVDISYDVKRLFDVWNHYNDRNIRLFRSLKLDSTKKTCPVLHCAWGFDKNELQHELPILKKGALRYKNQLHDIVQFGNNDALREQAIFILAHSTNYVELAHFLMKFTDDPSDVVRNNSMRVLGAILSQHEVKGIEIDRVLRALNYPYVTDRNKASYVLLNIIRHDKATHQLVIKKSGDNLVNLLRLKQPNNHDFAYSILKEISRQHFSETDYRSWQRWLNNEKMRLL